MYEYDGEDEGGRSIVRIAIGALVVVALIGGAWFVVKGRSGDDNAAGVIPAGSAETSTADSDVALTLAPAATTRRTTTTDAGATTTDGAAGTTSSAVTTTSAAPAATSTTSPPRTTTTERPTTTTERPRRQRQRRERPQPATYDTLPDGTPVPAVAIFDVNQITLNGAVPDQAAKDRLQALALANARPGQGNVVNFLTIDPAVPRSVGVRVVELTSTRFPTGSAEVRQGHAAELDRVVSIMSALPNITALVIGHSDQRGDDLGNYELSAARADAVIDYIAGKGITPDRLSSRAVGENDLLTLNNDAAALALNRRTEFVFYGLLIE